MLVSRHAKGGEAETEAAIRAARLDWEVVRTPLFYHQSMEATGVVPNLYAVVPDKGWEGSERPVFGVVTGISDTEIKLKELVQDSAGDWTERSSALQLQQPDTRAQGGRR